MEREMNEPEKIEKDENRNKKQLQLVMIGNEFSITQNRL